MTIEGWKSFPHPNPFIPAPPRGGASVRVLRFSAVLLILSPIACWVGFAVVMLTRAFGNSIELVATALFWGGFAALLFAAWKVPRLQREVSWNTGRVIPAMVDSNAGLDWPSVAYFLLSFVTCIGPLAYFSTSHVRLPIKWIEGGRVRCRRIVVHKKSDPERLLGKVVWVLQGGFLGAPAFVTASGDSHTSGELISAERVPEEVRGWFMFADYRAMKRRARQRELHKRAKRIAILRHDRGRSNQYK